MLDLVIPRFHTGETLPSMLKRTAAINQLGPARSAARVLLNEAWRHIRADVPYGLGQIGSCLWDLFGDRMEVLFEHTLLNAFLVCMTPRQREKYLQRLSRRTKGCLLPVRLPITLSPSPFCEWYCPQCDAADIHTHRETWCRCIHVLPFVSRCTEHDEFLLNRLSFPSEAAERFVGNASQRDASIAFAKEMASILRTRCDDLSQFHVEEIHHLTELGYMQKGRVRRSELVGSFQRQFIHGFEDRRLSTLVSESHVLMSWLERLFRGHPLHPAHAALIRMLDIPARQVRSTIPKGTRLAPPSASDVERALQSAGSLCKAAKLLRAGRLQVERIARENGLRVTWRPKKIGPELQAQIAKLAYAGAQPVEIAQQLAISIPSVYRHLPKRSPARRSDSSLHVEALRQKTRAQIEAEAAAGSSMAELRRAQPELWLWAYRHDRTWLRNLSKYMPASERIQKQRPPRFPRHLIDALKVARQSEYDANRLPSRLTRHRVVRASGFSEYLGNKLIEQCAPEIAETFSEARRAHTTRRIRFGEQVFGLDVGVDAASVIAKCVRLRPETVSAQLGRQSGRANRSSNLKASVRAGAIGG
ncbi:hypothetical protein BN2475_580051 [Paraburkholderia ribeironis]|uniref:Transposon Tn7 transposition protein TnsD C-terminal domain-containing protein n=1 Tax=Paraburkholderia ribeironis TaxID=1247936 RepID=A0A1N7SEC3_9BURK|nr:TnsD family Tn7-like transposition protein [Paraburkholderia ribeironis]SIT45690.1 hypothetical protein BN2475_580051 [Paraburkholderia ribeironis]